MTKLSVGNIVAWVGWAAIPVARREYDRSSSQRPHVGTVVAVSDEWVTVSETGKRDPLRSIDREGARHLTVLA